MDLSMELDLTQRQEERVRVKCDEEKEEKKEEEEDTTRKDNHVHAGEEEGAAVVVFKRCFPCNFHTLLRWGIQCTVLKPDR